MTLAPEALRSLVGAGDDCPCRLAVVNSCHGEAAGLAFAEAGVPHVVAVRGADGRLSDRAAIAFCRSFYLAAMAGRTVRQAFDIGTAAARQVAPP